MIGPMPAEDEKPALHARLLARLLHGAGQAPAEQRAAAFDGRGAPEPVRELLEKVATRSSEVSDGDFASGRAAGFTDDQLFELVICAAAGEANRQYTAGLAALRQATAPAGGE
jgi:hypothetical protein